MVPSSLVGPDRENFTSICCSILSELKLAKLDCSFACFGFTAVKADGWQCPGILCSCTGKFCPCPETLCPYPCMLCPCPAILSPCPGTLCSRPCIFSLCPKTFCLCPGTLCPYPCTLCSCTGTFCPCPCTFCPCTGILCPCRCTFEPSKLVLTLPCVKLCCGCPATPSAGNIFDAAAVFVPPKRSSGFWLLKLSAMRSDVLLTALVGFVGWKCGMICELFAGIDDATNLLLLLSSLKLSMIPA